MAPPAGSATTKPTPNPTPPPADVAKKPVADAAKPEGPKVEAKGEAKAEAEVKVDADASKFVIQDHFMGRVDLGRQSGSLGNGNSLFGGHTGFNLGIDLRYRDTFAGDKARWSVGARYDWAKLSLDLDPSESTLNTHSFGVTGGVAWTPSPWFAVGLDAFLGFSAMSSECTTTNEFGNCDGLTGTVINKNAQAYEVDNTGFKVGAFLTFETLHEVLYGRLGLTHNTLSITPETITQGALPPQSANFGGFYVGVGVDAFAIARWAMGGKKDKTKGSVTHTPRPIDAKPADKPGAAVKSAKPTKREATAQDLLKQLSGHKANIQKSATDAKKLETQIAAVAKAPKASFDGGQKEKDTKMSKLAREANSKAELAQAEYGDAKALLLTIEQKVAAMTAGEEKTAAEAEFKKAKAEFKKDGSKANVTMLEANHAAYKSYGRVKATYQSYAKRNKGAEKVDFDVSKPDGYGKKKWVDHRTPEQKAAAKRAAAKKAGSDKKPAGEPKPDTSGTDLE